MSVTIDVSKAELFLEKEELAARRAQAGALCRKLYETEDRDKVLGWRTAEHSVMQLKEIRAKAEEIRREADVFVIVGVGGSNQAARAVIEAIPERRLGPEHREAKGQECQGQEHQKAEGPERQGSADREAGRQEQEPGCQNQGPEHRVPEIVYLGNTLSPHYINQTLASMEGKSVYIDVIAKNFETLEPGSHFRILRQWMAKRYSKEEMAKRIVVTGTVGSRLEEIAKENGYLFLQFPVPVGGRYSAFTPVALFPMAAAGLDVDDYLAGMAQAQEDCAAHPQENPAVTYAAVRSLLYGKGYDIEMLASFEPRYAYLAKWWVQLFGESEGKEKKGIFPACAIYSEDLHSMGQYMQDGRRSLFETFVSVKDSGASAVIEACPEFGDHFDYLDGMDFDQLNKAAEAATWEAHAAGGVPCIRLEVERVSERTFGELFYYFMVSCAISGQLMGVNPFDQEGVEEYKRSMFAALGKY